MRHYNVDAQKLLVLLATIAIGPALTILRAQQPNARAANSPNAHHEGVASRGDHAMGFSQETTTHHFRLSKNGGVIDVSVDDPKDAATREQIRTRLSHIVKLFAAGDFDIPMFIHDTVPPGVSTMSKLRGEIRYCYRETPKGARVQISTPNPEAVQAIHDFLRFQIADHQTGDATTLTN
jgi:hypothetical protein